VIIDDGAFPTDDDKGDDCDTDDADGNHATRLLSQVTLLQHSFLELFEIMKVQFSHALLFPSGKSTDQFNIFIAIFLLLVIWTVSPDDDDMLITDVSAFPTEDDKGDDHDSAINAVVNTCGDDDADIDDNDADR